MARHKPKVGKRETKRLVAVYEQLVAEARAGGRLAQLEADEDDVDPLAPLRWFVLTVTPMCEKAVASRLKRRVSGVVTYWPIARRRVKRAGHYETIEWLPMPRYLFVGFAEAPPWLWVFDVQGVQGVLSIDDEPCEVKAGVIGELMWRCETAQVTPPATPVVQKGMPVLAKRGVMAGFEGSVEKVHKQTELADVLFDALGPATPVRMRLDDLVPVAYA